jgi:tetratricopeptide (TPR) repeat protein
MKHLIISIMLLVPRLFYAQNTCYESSWMLYMQGQYEKALSSIRQCIVEDSADYRLFLLQGNIQENLYQYDKALVSYNQALQLDEENKALKSSLAALYTKTGRIDLSAGLYAQLAEAEPENLHWKMKSTGALQSLGKHQQALEILRDVVRKDSVNWVIQREMGDCYFRLNNFDSAAIFYRKSLDAYPNNKSFIQLMRIKIKNEDYVAAIKTGREAVKFDSTNVEAWKQMGRAYFLINMKQNAIAVFDKAVALGDTSYLTCSHLGLIHHSEDYTLGIKYLEIALRQEPKDLAIMYYLSLAYKFGREFDKSIALLDKINKDIKPYDSIRIIAAIERGAVYRSQKRYSEAVKVYSEVLKSDPSQIGLYYSIADMYQYNLDKKKEALEWFIRYINKLDPKWETNVYEENTVLQYTKDRINRLKTDLFFEEGK